MENNYNAIFSCKHCASERAKEGLITPFIPGMIDEHPKACPRCGNIMIGIDPVTNREIGAPPIPTVKQTIVNGIEFGKDERSFDEWEEFFIKTALMYGERSSKTYEVYVNLVKAKAIPTALHLQLLSLLYVNFVIKGDHKTAFLKALKTEPKELATKRKAEIKKQLAALIEIDGKITIYRGWAMAKGGNKNRTSLLLDKAISFTTDYEKAKWFAHRPPAPLVTIPAQYACVFTARVELDDIVLYTDERKEKEVIFIPSKGTTEDYITNKEDVTLAPGEYETYIENWKGEPSE